MPVVSQGIVALSELQTSASDSTDTRSIDLTEGSVSEGTTVSVNRWLMSTGRNMSILTDADYEVSHFRCV